MVGSIAFSLGMALARLIEDSIISRGYFLSRNNCFMLSYWTSLLSVDEQILFILKNRENGIFLCWLSGWQLFKRKYLFLSVGFLYKSVSTLPFSIKHNVSKKGIFFFSGQSPLMGLFSIHVCSIVNLMFGLILFISSSSQCFSGTFGHKTFLLSWLFGCQLFYPWSYQSMVVQVQIP